MSQAEEYAINRASVKIPPFWTAQPELWFAIIESQFVLNHISSDDTKYNYVVSNLDDRAAAEVKDVILAPPVINKYGLLKVELITRLTASKECRLKQLLEQEELGDRKPSQFLRALKDLGGIDFPASLLKTIWLNRLPSNIQSILLTQENMPVEDVAKLADKLVEVIQPSVTAVAAAEASPSTSGNPFSALEKQIMELNQRLDNLQFQLDKGRPQPNRSPKLSKRKFIRSRSKSPGTSQNKNWCHYHNKYKHKAFYCSPPCSFRSENSRESLH